MIHFGPSRTSQSNDSIFLIKRNEFEKLLEELATNGSDQVRYEISFFLNLFTFEKVVK